MKIQAPISIKWPQITFNVTTKRYLEDVLRVYAREGSLNCSTNREAKCWMWVVDLELWFGS